MKVYFFVYVMLDQIVSGQESLTLGCNASFNLAGTTYNVEIPVTFTPPPQTDLLIAEAIKASIASYINITYGTSITALDVVSVQGLTSIL